MRSRVATLLLTGLVTACTVGPRYQEPELRDAGAFRPGNHGSGRRARRLKALVRVRKRRARRDHHPRARGQHDDRAGGSSPQRGSRLSGLSIYSWFPTVTAGAGREKAQFSTQDPLAPGGIKTDTYRAGFDASWEIDLFGSLRNEYHAIDRRVESRTASLADAQLSIVAETAQAWFSLIGARERLALRREQLANQQDNVRILTSRFNAGSSNGLDLAQAEAQMRSVSASLPLAEADLVREEQRLAVLTAWPIETLRANLSSTTELPELPALVATGSPEQWMKRRPDIRAAERELAASYSDIGDEMAEYFPKITLLGSFGWTGQSENSIGDDAAERWSYGPSISWSFLDFGRIHQHVKAAEARRDGQLAAYQETVLKALEETENALAGFRAANQSEDELRLGTIAATEAGASRAGATRSVPETFSP